MSKIGACRECGASFEAHRLTAEFCGSKCRSSFHNRRSRRGADLFDLFMCLRFDRSVGEESGAWSLMCRMAASFKAEDDRDRGGRRSWDDIRKVKARNVCLVGTRVAENAAGLRRPAGRT
jgi:hypothetical protein